MSLDTLELTMAIEDAFGIPIPDDVAIRMTTPRETIAFFEARLPAEPAERCTTQRTFYVLRSAIREALGTSKRLSPTTTLLELAPAREWRDLWPKVRAAGAASDWPKHLTWCDAPGSEVRLRDLTLYLATQPMPQTPAPDVPWTRERIELTVRRCVHESTGLLNFGLDDKYVDDMGLD